MTDDGIPLPENAGAARRQDHELPPVSVREGWRYHHMGVPTTIPRKGERYLGHVKMYVSGFETSPFGIEWMRFEDDSPVSALIRSVPHVAFVVDDLDVALQGRNVISDPSPLVCGGRVAMIIDDGAPVELLEFPRRDTAQE